MIPALAGVSLGEILGTVENVVVAASRGPIGVVGGLVALQATVTGNVYATDAMTGSVTITGLLSGAVELADEDV